MSVKLLGDARGFRNAVGDPAAAFPSSTTNFTVAFWLRFDAVNSGGFRTVWELSDGDNQPGWYLYGAYQGGNQFAAMEVWNGDPTWAEDDYHDIFAPPATIGFWHHYAYVKQGDQHSFYMDGQLVEAATTFTQPAVSDAWAAGNELLGAKAGEQGEWSTAQFRVWTAALSPSEIAAERLSATAVKTSGLFRDAALATVSGTDGSAGGHDLTVVGGAGMTAIGAPVPNTIPANARVITSLPYAITVSAEELAEAPNVAGTAPESGRHVPWWVYSAAPGETIMGVFGYSDPLYPYTPRLDIYTGTPGALVLAEVSGAVMHPATMPLASGTTYYIKIRDAGVVDPPGSGLYLTVEPGPTLPVQVGNLLINDDSEGYPAVVLSHTDGVSRRYVQMVSGEEGDILPSGIIAMHDNVRGEVVLYDTDFSVIDTITGFLTSVGAGYGEPQIRAAATGGVFYCGQASPVTGPAWVRTLAPDGTLGATTWTLPANSAYFRALAVSQDESTLYYSNKTPGEAIHAFDLVHNAALPDFVSGIPLHVVNKDLFVLADGSLLVGYEHGYSSFVRHYSAAGEVLRDFPVSDTLNRLAIDHNDPTVFWLWEFADFNVSSRFSKIRLSDGTVLTTFTRDEFEVGIGPEATTATPQRFGLSHSCPFLILTLGETPPETPETFDWNATGTVRWGASIPHGQRRLIRRMRQTAHLSDEEAWLFFSTFQLDMETGVGLETGQGSAPKIVLQWSDDHGHTFSNEHWIESGRTGAYRWRAIWRQLGRSRDRVWRIVQSDPVKTTWIDAYVDVKKGTH